MMLVDLIRDILSTKICQDLVNLIELYHGNFLVYDIKEKCDFIEKQIVDQNKLVQRLGNYQSKETKIELISVVDNKLATSEIFAQLSSTLPLEQLLSHKLRPEEQLINLIRLDTGVSWCQPAFESPFGVLVNAIKTKRFIVHICCVVPKYAIPIISHRWTTSCRAFLIKKGLCPENNYFPEKNVFHPSYPPEKHCQKFVYEEYNQKLFYEHSIFLHGLA